MLSSAEQYRRRRTALADRAVSLASRGDVGAVVVRHQAAGALMASAAVGTMLAEQRTPVEPVARTQPLAFTADPAAVDQLVAEIEDQWRFERLVGNLVLGSMLAAEQVGIASRPNVGYIRYVGPRCCSRCAILAGKFYRWSAGFLRHPGCQCEHVPTTDPRTAYRQDPAQLVREGRVTGLSKADQRALDAGADLGQIVNYRRSGLEQVTFGPMRSVTVSREGTTRHGLAWRGRTGRNMSARMTPASIFRVAESHEDALRLLRLHGYLI